MAIPLPNLGKERVAELETAWATRTQGWERKRLQVIRLVAQHKLNAEEIAEAVDVGRATVFRYISAFITGGTEALLKREHKGGRTGTLKAEDREDFLNELRLGRFRRAKEARTWIEQRTGKCLSLPSIYQLLGKVGGVLKVPRKTHAKKDPLAAEIFKFTLPERLAEASVGAERTRLWVLDEHRYGLLPVIRRCWGLRGVRVHAPYATKYQWGYLHEAMEVDGDNRMELLFTPSVDQDTHALFLRQSAETDLQARHIIIADQAGFHLKPDDARVPANMRLLPLPPYSPELNPVERLGDLVKDNICNQLFDKLPALERAILAELAPLRESGQRVAQLIGHGWLLDKVNSGVPK